MGQSSDHRRPPEPLIVQRTGAAVRRALWMLCLVVAIPSGLAAEVAAPHFGPASKMSAAEFAKVAGASPVASDCPDASKGPLWVEFQGDQLTARSRELVAKAARDCRGLGKLTFDVKGADAGVAGGRALTSAKAAMIADVLHSSGAATMGFNVRWGVPAPPSGPVVSGPANSKVDRLEFSVASAQPQGGGGGGGATAQPPPHAQPPPQPPVQPAGGGPPSPSTAHAQPPAQPQPPPTGSTPSGPQPSSAQPTGSGAGAVSQALHELPVVYHKPPTMNYGKANVFELVIASKDLEEARQRIAAQVGPEVIRNVALGQTVRAKLWTPSNNVAIDSRDDADKPVTSGANVHWIWSVTPKASGDIVFVLSIYNLTDGKEVDGPVFTDTFKVSEPWTDQLRDGVASWNPVWVALTGALTLLGGWALWTYRHLLPKKVAPFKFEPRRKP
jgi:hypothetical protein